jgi:hypothetical protein
MEGVRAECIVILKHRQIGKIAAEEARAGLALIEDRRLEERLALDVQVAFRETLSAVEIVVIQVLPREQSYGEVLIPVGECE